MENSEITIHASAPVRMRTQAQALAEVKAVDSNSALTAHFLRQLVIQKKIKVVMAGNRYLVNLDSLFDYLANPPQDEEVKESGYGCLRKIGG
jgi:hypothetical protein